MSLEMNCWAHTQELMDVVNDFVILHEEGYDKKSLEMHYWAHTQKLMDIVDSFVNLYNQGYDINSEEVQNAVFIKHELFDELTDYDKNYIKIEVERRL